jgi:ribonucleoside-diphosphate reductase alpha chain
VAVHDKYVTREDGLVCCKIYKTLPARRMWDVIMTSTYDFAEPGFILIDRVNEMNNNWWCENIRATNPCVTADYLGADQPKGRVRSPISSAAVQRARRRCRPREQRRRILPDRAQAAGQVATAEGHSLRLTSDHRVRRIATADPLPSRDGVVRRGRS